MKKLPVGISSFSKLIENDYIYIDKTKYLYDMITSGELYFLSRPRRFGKSLIVSTLGEIFKGNKDLFEGLYIYNKWNFDEKYPVIHLDFNDIRHTTPEKLESTLNDFVNSEAREHDIKLYNSDLTNRFSELIKGINKKYKRKVVILIDEYDNPIIDCMKNIEIAKKNRDILRDFYRVLKSTDKYLRFVFLTGISKFAKTSIFSDLNHLDDISLYPEYSEICGYSQEDLENSFHDYILKTCKSTGLSREELLSSVKDWYNGYSWDGENFLYNPFSILKLFRAGEFANYWAETGTPKLLVDILKTTNVDLNTLITKKSEFHGAFPNFSLEKMHFDTVLLQTGYLTIKDKKYNPPKPSIFTTEIPNKEVEESLFSYILASFANQDIEDIVPLAFKIKKAILAHDEEGLQTSFESLLENIPNIIKSDIKNYNETYFKILFITWLHCSGFDIEGEVMNYTGRLDALIRTKEFHLIIEFKYSEKKSLDEMLEECENQIIKKGYYKPYQDKNLFVLSIATISRNIKCRFKSFEDILKQYKNT